MINLHLSKEKNGCTARSCTLNTIVRMLVQKGEVIRNSSYLAKFEQKNFSIAGYTAELLISVVSEG